MQDFNSEEPHRLTNDDLYLRQVAMLKGFLERKAISQAQFDKSFGDLTEKMYPDKTKIPKSTAE